MHPWAWWCWALGVAVAVSLTTNPLFLILLAAALAFVIIWRRTDAPWAKSFGVFLRIALVIIVVRMVFQIVIGANQSGHVLFTLPRIDLPAWAAGIRIGGPVSAEGILFTLYDSLRLAVMLLCVGAANALANPKRALRSVPGALYEVSVAVIIALTVAPQIIDSTQRIRRARRLRGGPGHGFKAVRGVVIPVLEDAVDRSLTLAAGMEVRGFGRTRRDMRGRSAVTALLVASSAAVTFGLFALLGIGDALGLAVTLLVAGTVGVGIGVRLSGRRLAVTRYRPDPWAGPEWALVGCGGLCAGVGIALGSWAPLLITQTQLAWPQLHPAMLVAAAAAAAPAIITPVPPNRALEAS